MSGDAAVQAKVDQLARSFLARLPARLDTIDAAGHAVPGRYASFDHFA